MHSSDIMASEVAEVKIKKMPKFSPVELNLNKGEKLVYDIKWSGVPVGQSILEVKAERQLNGLPIWELQCSTRSNAFVEQFYPVNNNAVTLIDVKTGHSHLFKQSRLEGRFGFSENIHFDYDKSLAVYERRLTSSSLSDSTTKSAQINGLVADPLSCIYYLRGVALKPGGVVSIPVHTTRRTWALEIIVLRRERIETKTLGSREAYKLKINTAFSGLFVRRGSCVVWVDKITHIPLRMNVDIPIGAIEVNLVGYAASPLASKKKAASSL